VREREDAQAKLEGPGEPPSELWYLREWFGELTAHRRITMEGAEPIGWETLDAWARLTGRTPDSIEVDALMRMDLAVRYPKEPEGAEA